MGNRDNGGETGKRAKVRFALLCLLILAAVVTGLGALCYLAFSPR